MGCSTLLGKKQRKKLQLLFIVKASMLKKEEEIIMKIEKKIYLSLLAILALILTSMGHAEAQTLPKLIVMASPSVGTVQHTLAMGAAHVISRLTPIQCRVEPGEFLAGLQLQHAGQVELIFSQMGTMAMAILGWPPFDKKDWGPQPVRVLWMGYPTGSVHIGVAANSKIFKFSDLKGKRVADVIVSPAGHNIVNGFLEYAGLTRKDVITIKFADYSKAWDGLLEGLVDATILSPTSPSAYKIAASPQGLRLLECPHNDKKYWEIMHKHAPYVVPLLFPFTAASKDKPFEGQGIAAAIASYPQLDAAVAYLVTKAIDEGYEELQSFNKEFGKWTLEETTAIKGLANTVYVFHPGSIRYFKEKGKWTQQHENWYQKVLKLEKEREEGFKAKMRK
jgi:TRAP transporter TAXI family solute receptor